MTCSACSARVEKSVKCLSGVQSVQVNLLTNSMNVEYDSSAVDDNGIISAVENAGYGASVKGGQKENAKQDAGSAADKAQKAMKSRLIWSFVFLIPLMYVSMGHMMWNWTLPSFLDGLAAAPLFP